MKKKYKQPTLEVFSIPIQARPLNSDSANKVDGRRRSLLIGGGLLATLMPASSFARTKAGPAGGSDVGSNSHSYPEKNPWTQEPKKKGG